MLFNEPKLLKSNRVFGQYRGYWSFSALQRAEIAEIDPDDLPDPLPPRFSALQRAEIAEMAVAELMLTVGYSFSALQRAEIAEIERGFEGAIPGLRFQCSSTSRNC